MKIIKLLFICLVLVGCNRTISPLGEKSSNLNSRCDNCETPRNKKYYRANGIAEIKAGPRVEDAAVRQAKELARRQLSQDIATEVQTLTAGISETMTEGADQEFRDNLTEAFMNTSYAFIQDSRVNCIDKKMIKKDEYIRVIVCLEIDGEEFSNDLYRKNKSQFANANIDYETFKIKLSGGVKER